MRSGAARSASVTAWGPSRRRFISRGAPEVQVISRTLDSEVETLERIVVPARVVALRLAAAVALRLAAARLAPGAARVVGPARSELLARLGVGFGLPDPLGLALRIGGRLFGFQLVGQLCLRGELVFD